MKYSDNYGLKKPDWDDQYNLDHWNENTDKIDAQMRKNQDEIEGNDRDIATLFAESSKTNDSVAATNAKIPSAASAENQLADKNFVNSSIATNTANFVGTFESLNALNAYSGAKTNNDYAFVKTTDTVGNTLYNRYKWNGAQWLFEFTVNNTSFTQAQMNAINSGATASKINQIKNMGGASSNANGSEGLVPAPQAGQQGCFLCGDGTWQQVSNLSAQAVFDISHPVGDLYKQYPQQEDPHTLYNKNGVTSTWTIVDYNGAFFRAQGGNAESFIDKNGVLKKQTDSVNKDRLSATFAGDTIEISPIPSGYKDKNQISGEEYYSHVYYEGQWHDFPREMNYTGSTDKDIHGKYGTKIKFPLTGKISIGGDAETRPANYTIRVWKRTA